MATKNKNSKEGTITHDRGALGRSKTVEYRTWAKMIQRCYNPRHNVYPNYGGRGIKVCDDWLGKGGFKNFFAHLGLRKPKMTLDRIDSNKDYSPENCRWASMMDQQRNKRTNVWIEYKGKAMCQYDACTLAGFNVKVLIQFHTRRNTLHLSKQEQFDTYLQHRAFNLRINPWAKEGKRYWERKL